MDGLWFVKTEEMSGFNTALELDREVWKVMPKIQARFIKEKLEAGEGLVALGMCFSKKLKLDGFEFQIKEQKDDGSITGVSFIISRCPWHDILIKSKRGHFSDKIGGVICGTEYKVWASEFGKDIRFSFGESRICRGNQCCILSFDSGREKK